MFFSLASFFSFLPIFRFPSPNGSLIFFVFLWQLSFGRQFWAVQDFHLPLVARGLQTLLHRLIGTPKIEDELSLIPQDSGSRLPLDRVFGPSRCHVGRFGYHMGRIEPQLGRVRCHLGWIDSLLGRTFMLTQSHLGPGSGLTRSALWVRRFIVKAHYPLFSGRWIGSLVDIRGGLVSGHWAGVFGHPWPILGLNNWAGGTYKGWALHMCLVDLFKTRVHLQLGLLDHSPHKTSMGLLVLVDPHSADPFTTRELPFSSLDVHGYFWRLLTAWSIQVSSLTVILFLASASLPFLCRYMLPRIMRATSPCASWKPALTGLCFYFWGETHWSLCTSIFISETYSSSVISPSLLVMDSELIHSMGNLQFTVAESESVVMEPPCEVGDSGLWLVGSVISSKAVNSDSGIEYFATNGEAAKDNGGSEGETPPPPAGSRPTAGSKSNENVGVMNEAAVGESSGIRSGTSNDTSQPVTAATKGISASCTPADTEGSASAEEIRSCSAPVEPSVAVDPLVPKCVDAGVVLEACHVDEVPDPMLPIVDTEPVIYKQAAVDTAPILSKLLVDNPELLLPKQVVWSTEPGLPQHLVDDIEPVLPKQATVMEISAVGVSLTRAKCSLQGKYEARW
ncbi:hypothetical protein V6N11_056294 [Hibiscus sabdariffa]|uniref:Uncharacterized protein n=1 Tax=Hibiscus sabdariffa TaxID=183260 RepID=A0ABR2T3N4_9ROSI